MNLLAQLRAPKFHHLSFATADLLARNSYFRHPWSRALYARHVHNVRPTNPTILRRHNVKVHLLGTMHIAEASATAARDLIHREHAKGTLGYVFLELDATRHARLVQRSRDGPDESLFSLALSTLTHPKSSPLSSLIELAFKSMYRMLHQLGFASGVEFSAAIEASSEVNVPLVLGDQHIAITMSKLADGFRADFDISRLMALALANAQSSGLGKETPFERALREAFQAIASGDVEQGQKHLSRLIDPTSIHEVTRPMRTWFPSVTDVILHQRDLFMVEKLIEAADSLPEGKDSIVAIVGLAHMDGIIREWGKRHARSSAVAERP